MVIYEYPANEKLNISECLLALGFFDGVHIAHRNLLEKAKDIAEKKGLSFGIFTFKSSGEIKGNTGRLYDDVDKAEIFRSLGADFVVFADFSAISMCSPEDFVKEILWQELNCQSCVAGFNFRFGKGASAGAEDLARLMAELGGDTEICDEITADGSTLSATIIRNLILNGDMDEANRLLGSPYYIKGRVLHGRTDGRKIGFPTANILIKKGKLVPKFGVYRSAVKIGEQIYSAVSNIGVCPTFNGEEIRLEAHIIDFDGDLYDQKIKVFLLGYIREEKRFDSIDELKMQIIVDKNTVIEENGDIKWLHLGQK